MTNEFPVKETASIISWLRYVTHARIAAYEALGWTDLGAIPGHHGAYSNLMEWTKDGPPVEPPPVRQ